MAPSICELLHQFVHLLVDVAYGALDDQGGVVRHAVAGAEHVEKLIRGEQDVGKLVENALGHREMHGGQRIEGGCGFQGHSTQE
jgi:hypothetical protein